jgi:hypothetical protein
VFHKQRSGFVLILHLQDDHWFNNNGYHGDLGYLHTWSFLIALFIPWIHSIIRFSSCQTLLWALSILYTAILNNFFFNNCSIFHSKNTKPFLQCIWIDGMILETFPSYFFSSYLTLMGFELMALSFLDRQSYYLNHAPSPSAVVVSLNRVSSFSQVSQESDLPYD